MSGSSTKRGSALATALFVTFFAAGAWVLVMALVLGTERKVELPAQLAKHHLAGPLVTISENTDPRYVPASREDAMARVDATEPASLLWPTRTTRLSSTFGYRINPITGEGQLHRGVDVPAPCGSEVVAVEEGTVTFAEWTESSGNTISIAHEGGWVTRYAHLSRLAVHAGQHVAAGAHLGLTGDTGALSTGPHLHFEIWSGKSAVDPMAFRYRELRSAPAPSTAVACGKARPATAVAMGSMETPNSIEAKYASIIRR
jgi:murein DD-endopeptidase MepM/ murein hydrolase activator NlpD